MPIYRIGFIAWVLVGYVAAALASITLPQLPSRAGLIAASMVAIVLLAMRRLPLIAGALLGILVATSTARESLEHRIAACVDGVTVELRGRIVGLPKVAAPQIQFDVAPEAIAPWPRCAGPMPQRVRLSWFAGPGVAPGELWQLRAKLRGVRGYQNPGGFDYEAWSLGNGLDGGGSVRYGRRESIAAHWSWDRLRLELRDRVAAASLQHTGIVLALLTGDGALMSDADWALFRATGTVHLMVISGLHLAIVATVGAFVGRGLARLWPRRLARSGSAMLSVICATLLVTLYACLAGWGVPVLRAWVASIVVLFAIPLGRRLSLPIVFLWVAAIVLSVDPLAPLQAGTWLSLGAVGILLAHFAPRLQRHSALRALLTAQVVMAVAMVPALLTTIGSVAWVGPIANLLAVPLVSVVIVPIDLLAGLAMTVFGGDGGWLLQVADSIVGFVVAYLRAVAAFGWMGWPTDRGTAAFAVTATACALLLLPLTRRHRVLLAPCVLLPFAPGVADFAAGQYRATVLDVGQGLAVVVDTARHRLLFDAGPRFPSGFDLGSAVVLPSLQHPAREQLDLAILSHSDMDHVGGYRAVSRSMRVRALIGGQPVIDAQGLRACHAGQAWQWDGVRFRVLHPERADTSDNDSSCVLLIDNGRERALLPGDITQAGEAELLTRLGADRIDLIVAAHHGSRSSSSEPFVQATRPRIVAISAGYLNRFGHPHPQIVCRFIRAGAQVYVTAYSGALSWRSDHPGAVLEWRTRSPPYWRVGNELDGSISPGARCDQANR